MPRGASSRVSWHPSASSCLLQGIAKEQLLTTSAYTKSSTKTDCRDGRDCLRLSTVGEWVAGRIAVASAVVWLAVESLVVVAVDAAHHNYEVPKLAL